MKSVKEITVTVNSKEITLDLYATAYYDSNYGADADGNRGMGVYFIDEVTWETPECDDDGNKLSEDEKKALNVLLNTKIDDIEF